MDGCERILSSEKFRFRCLRASITMGKNPGSPQDGGKYISGKANGKRRIPTEAVGGLNSVGIARPRTLERSVSSIFLLRLIPLDMRNC